jgi:hypothetical protein
MKNLALTRGLLGPTTALIQTLENELNLTLQLAQPREVACGAEHLS